MKNMIKMEIGWRTGDVTLLQEKERNKGTHPGDMALNGSDVVCVCVCIHHSKFSPFNLLNSQYEVWKEVPFCSLMPQKQYNYINTGQT